jgi:hypothetical protein
MKVSIALTGIVLVLGALSCNFPTDEHTGRFRLVATKPDKKDLVGTWIIDAPTIKYMRTHGGYDVSQPTSLVLRDDDSFAMTNMPDWYKAGSGESNQVLGNLAGSWDFDDSRGGFWAVALRASEFAPYIEIREPRYASQPRYVLQIVIGDPDSRNFMRFTKS